ncbi:sensor domain-containing diguanylate cyclase [Defluviitalea phaphyphila]|uniref:sensor domain-containing diguanylate cyclase n=1 Tax=Defluviitalea phaphyphila TaxID=1473580 RepID=UPI000730F36C|nr:diguanylate cyclase [Defluviitalea phaphyphila]
MTKSKSLEKYYTYIYIGILLFILIHLELSKLVENINKISLSLVITIIGLITMVVKLFILEKGLLEKGKIYILLKIAELFVASFFIYYEQEVNIIGALIYVLTLLEIFSFNNELKFMLYYFSPIIITGILMLGKEFFTYYIIINTIFIILLDIFIIYIVQCILKDIIEKKEEVSKLLEQEKEKNKQLIEIKKHIEKSNKELERQKEEMRKTRDSFRNSVAELFILKETSSYIGSILEIQQLLELVCDMIMGIMGVDSCSIIVYNEKDSSLDFHVKSIYSKEVIENFKAKGWSSYLREKMKNKEILIDNNVDPNKYSFLEGRKVGSFVAVPLRKGNTSYGLILAEHSLENYFSTSSTDLFKAVSMQVAMAIENAKLYEKMEEIAEKDGLTNIYNRLYLQKIMPKLVEDAKKNNTPISVAIFDIDHFKKFNDTYGHIFGDEVLKAVANLAKKKLEAYGGIIARYGGEEFFMIFPNLGIKEVADIVEELRQEIENIELKKQNIKAKITASFGVSGYPEIADNYTELIRTADDAMYCSKNRGRNCVTIAPINVKCNL